MLAHEVSNPGRRSRGRQHRRRHLIEQRLKDVVVASIDEDYVGVGSLESARRGDPGEARADDNDALSSAPPIRGGRFAIISAESQRDAPAIAQCSDISPLPLRHGRVLYARASSARRSRLIG